MSDSGKLGLGEFDADRTEKSTLDNQWAIECSDCGSLMPDTKAFIRGAQWQHSQDVIRHDAIVSQLMGVIEIQKTALMAAFNDLRYTKMDLVYGPIAEALAAADEKLTQLTSLIGSKEP